MSERHHACDKRISTCLRVQRREVSNLNSFIDILRDMPSMEKADTSQRKRFVCVVGRLKSAEVI